MKKIPLTQDQFALIDDKDFELVSQYKWCVNKNGKTFYAYTTIRKPESKKTNLYMHRLILKPADGLDSDHRDGNGLNNQRYNLRVCTHQENLQNQRPTRGNSKYKGVSWDKTAKKWKSYIGNNGKRRHLGWFIDETEAAKAYDTAAKELFGEFSYLNFQKKG